MLDKDQIEDWEGKLEKRKPAPAGKPPEGPVAERVITPEPAEKTAAPVAAAAQFGEAQDTGERVVLTPEQSRARKRRSQWTALALFAFVILIFVITMAKLGGNIAERM